MKTIEVTLDELGGLRIDAKEAGLFEVYLILTLASLEAQKKMIEAGQIFNLPPNIKRRNN